MNGQARDLMSLRLALLCGAALALSACASVSSKLPAGEAPLAATSPAAARIEAILAKPGDFPTFASIPPMPADVPTDAGFKSQVEADLAVAAETTASTAPDTWQLDASDAFAARAAADAGGVRPPTDAEIAESEAFARASRDRAKPPPRPR